MTKSTAMIFDLDGTLANVTPARHYVLAERSKDRDFTAFHSYASNEAEPHEWVAERAREYSQMGFRIILVSGRHEKWRDDTKKWLKRHNIDYTWMFMRPDDDGRKDYVLKREIYDKKIEPFYDVIMAFDDNPNIVRLWKELGITTVVVPGWEERS